MKFRKKNKMNRHHLVNKVNGGGANMQNILWIKVDRHQFWHRIFGNLSLDEVITLLLRVKSAKKNQQNEHSRKTR